METELAKQGSVIPQSVKEEWENKMLRIGYLTEKDGKFYVRKDVKKFSGNDSKVKRDDFVKRTIFTIYKFSYNDDDISDIYFRRADEQSYHRLSPDGRELRDLVNSLFEKFFGATPQGEVNSCIKNIMNNVGEVAELHNGMWYICHDLFWDSERCELNKSFGDTRIPAFRELGSCKGLGETERAALIRSFDEWRDRLSNHLDEDFKDFYMTLPMDFDFIKVWAGPIPDGDDLESLYENNRSYVDKYWDILCSYSTLFMKNKPPIAYMLIGNARGGKSSMVNSLHYLVGNNNSSRTRIVDMADWSVNNTLASCMLNAPDEEPAEQPSAAAKANFKSIIAHENTLVKVKNARMPKMVRPDFISFFPMNSLPNWGSDSDACMKRSRPIMFMNDLSKLDHKPKDFIAETFTPEFTAKFLGAVLALTWFFGQDKEMFYSDTMLSSIDYVSESVNSSQLYYRYFKKYCFGYGTLGLLYSDYKNFCSARGYEAESKEVLKQRFFIEGQARTKISINNTMVNIYAGESKNVDDKAILHDKTIVPNYGNLADCVMKYGMSYVDYLDNVHEKALEEANAKKESFEKGWK